MAWGNRAVASVACAALVGISTLGCSSHIGGDPVAVPAPATTVSPTDAAAAAVKVSMQDKFDSDPDMSKLGLKIVNVVLINKAGNEYTGMATIKGTNGVQRDVPLDVTADGDNAIWTMPPGALLVFALPNDQTPQPVNTPPAASPSVPGADMDGFLNGPRCADQADLILLTAQSAVVICDEGGSYVYEGMRLQDGGRISLPASPTADGYAATNATDGTRYEVTRNGLVIYTRGHVYTEQATAAGP